MPIPVLNVAQMREWENLAWASGITQDSVMRRAGEAVARCSEGLTRPDARILILAGKGHNGDDAAFAHEYLRGRRGELLRIIDPTTGLRELNERLHAGPALIVDGLFGIGLNRPLDGAWPALIERVNESRAPILAVDVPSGLDADTGRPLDTAIRATHTLTFAGIKRGLLAASASEFVGRLEVAGNIGLAAPPFSTELHATTPNDFAEYPPTRPAAGHKGSFGHLAIIAGSPGYHGAAVLAARGAQRAQPGLITLCAEPGVRLPIAAQLQSVMVHDGTEDFVVPTNATAILVGPGLASPAYPEDRIRAIRRLWQESPLPIVADASALDWLPEEPSRPNTPLRVITPHPGEAARMLRCTVEEVQQDRVAALRELSRRWGNCHVMLKGQHTLIGQATGPIAVNPSGNPHLAQGGAGDLLAGYIAGLLAQPVLRHDIPRTIQFAAWQHGAAADALFAKRPNFIIEELAGELGLVTP